MLNGTTSKQVHENSFSHKSKSEIKSHGFCNVLNIILANINKTERYILILTIILLTAIAFDIANNEVCINRFFECILHYNRCAVLSSIINILPTLIGFSITGYAIILSLGNKLQDKGRRNNDSILTEISADFIFTISYQIIVLILGLAAKIFNIQSYSWCFMCVILTFLSIYLILNIVFHLFAFHSFCKR